jgi:hypothetical protein
VELALLLHAIDPEKLSAKGFRFLRDVAKKQFKASATLEAIANACSDYVGAWKKFTSAYTSNAVTEHL